MLIGTNGPEDYDIQAGGNSNGNFARTKRINQEVILDLVYITRIRLIQKKKNEFLWKRTGSPPSCR
jgi:hypothetical protein